MLPAEEPRVLDPKSIQNNHLVYGLEDEQVACIASYASERNLSEGEALCRQGEVGQELFIVLSGRFSVQIGDGDQLAELGPGSVVGEMGLIEQKPRPRSATVLALEPSRVAAIPKIDLRNELISDGNLGFLVLCNITRVLSDRLQMADERMGTLFSTAIQA